MGSEANKDAADSRIASDAQPKRRACDECRSRKLACSKEQDGCARCKRDGAKCVYSAQKTMGRPRKRPFAQMSEAVATPDDLVPEPEGRQGQQLKHQQLKHQQLQQHLYEQIPLWDDSAAASFLVPPIDPTLGMELDMSFLDVGQPSLNFLDVFDPDFQLLDISVGPGSQLATTPKEPATQPSPRPSGPWNVMGSTRFGDIDFDVPPPELPPTPPPKELSIEYLSELLSVASAELQELPPSLSPSSSLSTSSNSSDLAAATPPDPGASHTRPPTCGCVAALFRAIESLQIVPSEVGPALKAARSATKTAYEAIHCPVCGDGPVDSSPPVAPLQTMMMLGGLLPTLTNAYMRILEMVDAEAERATAESRQIVFTFQAYGGMWGRLLELDADCGGGDKLEGALMEPHMWRLTIRALLKVDVYGINGKTANSEAIRSAIDGVVQPGLKDIIAMMEERSEKRHRQLDEMVASGALRVPGHCHYAPMTQETPPCMKIIDLARKSVDDPDYSLSHGSI